MSGPGTLAERVRYFLPTFLAGNAPLYAFLTERAAIELEWPASPFRLALEAFIDERPEQFVWLRLLALVHRWVLAGELPDLARYYPSAGGVMGPAAVTWQVFKEAVVARGRELPELLNRPLQHNEVGRAAALACGFMLVARETRLPLRALEVGASAGLLLRWDHYLRCAWFPAMFAGEPPDIGTEVRVSERRGCDLHPVEATSGEDGLYLRSMVWADLVGHLRALEEAIAVSAAVPAVVDQADGAEWLPKHGLPRSGEATVIYHSMMRASGPPGSLPDIDKTVWACSRYVTRNAPLAYLRFEARESAEVIGARGWKRPTGYVASDPSSQVQVRLTMWPGGEERWLATCDVNGRMVRWLLR
jgi:hypothetical protein